MPRQRVYVETTIISYLTARPSRDVVMASHQQVTQEWWDQKRRHFDLFVSEIVVREILSIALRRTNGTRLSLSELP